MPPKKKTRHPLQSSSKLARLQNSLKSGASAKSKKKVSTLAGASRADAAFTTAVVGTTDSSTETVNVSASTDLNLEVSSSTQTTTDPDAPEAVETDTPAVSVEVAAPTAKVSSGTKNYASLLKESAKLEELGTPSEHVSGAPFVLIPDDNIAAAKEEFRDFIFARFPSDSPPMGRIIGVVNAIWAKSGPRIFVHQVGNGEYLLKVTNPKTRALVLGRTCWNIGGLPMFVTPWSPEFTPEEAPLTSAVVPVELRGVPYLLFNKESLSRLATAVGKPISLAPETERKENFQVAKLYVRVDLTNKLPTKIISGFSSGREMEISVTYPWLPVKCGSCGKYGHVSERCRANLEKSASGRRRSASPSRSTKGPPRQPGQGRENKHQSRLGRSPAPGNSNRENNALEEGEILLDSKHISVIPSVTEEINAPPVSSEITKGKCQDAPGLDETVKGHAATSSVLKCSPKGPDTEGLQSACAELELIIPGESAEDNPFFLVNRRKSGRKASSSL
ncbi:hypothetical protein N665_0283s0023 [Sinapis alba]|nr:hypothetical protein N665_0283s0023 [Sinapis alba]